MSQSTAPLSPLVSPAPRQQEKFLGFTLTGWLQIIVVGVLMCALFRFNLWRLWGKTNPFYGEDSNWQHSIFVPLIGIYYLYIHREELVKAIAAKVKFEKSIRIVAGAAFGLLCIVIGSLVARDQSGTLGMLLILSGILAGGLTLAILFPTSPVFGTVLLFEGLLVFLYGIYPGQNDYIKDIGMVITVFGVATLLGGWEVMKVAWFPICFLIVAIPWPDQVYSTLAWPLQRLAASAAVGTLRLFGVESHNYGTKIVMLGKDGPRTLNVAEACAGLRSLMTFVMVAGTVAFLSSRPLWEKLVQSFTAIPIAIFCNVVRVAGQGLLDFYVSQELSQNFAHQFVGLIMLIPGFFLILLVGWIMDKLFIDEVDPRRLAGARRAAARRRAAEPVRQPQVAAPVRNAMAADTAPASIPQSMQAAMDAMRSEPVIPMQPMAMPASGDAPNHAPAAHAASAATARPAPAPVAPAHRPVPRRPVAAPPAPAGGAHAAPAAPRSPTVPSGLKPSATRAAASHAVPMPPSTLKPSIARVQPAQTMQPGSTLKPSSRPAPARPATIQPTLKPSAPRPVAGAPAAPRPAATPARAPVQPAAPKPAAPVKRVPPAPAAAEAPESPQPESGDQ